MTNLGPTGSPWDTAAPVPAVAGPGGNVTLVEGQAFCISNRSGDITAEGPHGVFLLDTRILSRFELSVNGHRLEALASTTPAPFTATFASRAAPSEGTADADLVILRTRHLGQGLRERFRITSHALRPRAVTIELHCDADFAGLFEVKESRVTERERTHSVEGGSLVIGQREGDALRRTVITPSSPAHAEPGRICWTEVLAPHQTREVCVEVAVEAGPEPLDLRFRCQDADDGGATPSVRLDAWRARLPTVATDRDDLATAVTTAGEDLGALRIFDPDHPDVAIVAAGAPWFMTVFGRDSLLTGWMTLLADPSLAQGVLETLARFQGRDVDPRTEEEPGKILHEMRFGPGSSLALRDADVYYGSIDATPLFVMLLGEWARWGQADDVVTSLLPHADRALAWIEDFGDRDGDGYVEYQRANPTGLANQGWKDSWDAIRMADGRLPAGPIALCEVQGYVYSAYLARAHFAWQQGDAELLHHYASRAAELQRRFNEDFWLEEHGTYALALDGDKRPVDAVTSNPGHCLWTGIVDPERAPIVADRLLAPDLFCGWGLRTLATTMAAYNPVSYHNGSVWPHDNALCAAGLARYGLVEHAHRIIEGQLAAARANGNRLPELFAGFARDELAVPGAYPASCSPQAWAAAAPLLWLRTLLRLDPWVPHGKVWVSPALPASIRRLRVEGIHLGDSRLDVDVDGDDITVGTRGPALEIDTSPRPPLSAVIGQERSGDAVGPA